MRKLFWVLVMLAGTMVAAAAANIGGSGVTGLRTHDHSSAGKGGATISGATATGGNIVTTDTAQTITATKTFGGSVSPEFKFLPTSGATKSADFSQTADVLNIGAAGVANQIQASLLAPDGSLIIGATGSLSSSRACASGFTRASPNLCLRTDTISETTVPTSCTSLTLPVSGATSLIVHYNLDVTGSNNAAVVDQAILELHGDSGCTTPVAKANGSVREFVAINNTRVLQLLGTLTVPVVSGALWERATKSAGAATVVNRQIRGYAD